MAYLPTTFSVILPDGRSTGGLNPQDRESGMVLKRNSTKKDTAKSQSAAAKAFKGNPEIKAAAEKGLQAFVDAQKYFAQDAATRSGSEGGAGAGEGETEGKGVESPSPTKTIGPSTSALSLHSLAHLHRTFKLNVSDTDHYRNLIKTNQPHLESIQQESSSAAAAQGAGFLYALLAALLDSQERPGNAPQQARMSDSIPIDSAPQTKPSGMCSERTKELAYTTAGLGSRLIASAGFGGIYGAISFNKASPIIGDTLSAICALFSCAANTIQIDSVFAKFIPELKENMFNLNKGVDCLLQPLLSCIIGKSCTEKISMGTTGILSLGIAIASVFTAAAIADAAMIATGSKILAYGMWLARSMLTFKATLGAPKLLLTIIENIHSKIQEVRNGDIGCARALLELSAYLLLGGYVAYSYSMGQKALIGRYAAESFGDIFHTNLHKHADLFGKIGLAPLLALNTYYITRGMKSGIDFAAHPEQVRCITIAAACPTGCPGAALMSHDGPMDIAEGVTAAVASNAGAYEIHDLFATQLAKDTRIANLEALELTTSSLRTAHENRLTITLTKMSKRPSTLKAMEHKGSYLLVPIKPPSTHAESSSIEKELVYITKDGKAEKIEVTSWQSFYQILNDLLKETTTAETFTEKLKLEDFNTLCGATDPGAQTEQARAVLSNCDVTTQVSTQVIAAVKDTPTDYEKIGTFFGRAGNALAFLCCRPLPPSTKRWSHHGAASGISEKEPLLGGGRYQAPEQVTFD